VLNQNVPPRYLARTVLISLGNYPRVFFMQKSAFYSNPSPTFGYDPTFLQDENILLTMIIFDEYYLFFQTNPNALKKANWRTG
jgi:hypothetical protein